MKVLCAVALVLACAPSAAAAPRTATTPEGVRITLDGRRATMRLPRTVPSGSDVLVRCGAGRTSAQSISGDVRYRERLSVRLRGPLRAPEWCGFHVWDPTGLTGADGGGVLQPRVSPPPPPAVGPGPGVRSGATADDDAFQNSEDLEGDAGDAAFHLAGRTLTVRFRKRFSRSGVVELICFPDRPDPALPENPGAAIGSTVVRPGSRTATAILFGGDVSAAAACLAEDGLDSGMDIAAGRLGP